MLGRLDSFDRLLADERAAVVRLESQVDGLNAELVPLQKNRQDLEQGMRRMTELSQDVYGNMQGKQTDDAAVRGLTQELKDQQEAMDALMDMLEKTITVEVRLSALAPRCDLARCVSACCVLCMLTFARPRCV